jgi:RHS repeat-associated protein
MTVQPEKCLRKKRECVHFLLRYNNFHSDRLASVRLITDENATVKKKYAYKAFGASLQDSGYLNNDYKYTSQALDENDLYYMHARYYDNSTGRFLNPDPAKVGHSYNYTPANPVNFVDPSGLIYAPSPRFTVLESAPSIASWHMSIYGPGGWLSANQGFIDVSGQEETWYYTDLWCYNMSKGNSEEDVAIINVIVNMLWNPLHSLLGINLGWAIENISVMIAPETMNFNDIGESRPQQRTIAVNKGITEAIKLGDIEGFISSSKAMGLLMGTIIHEIGHQILFDLGVGNFYQGPDTERQEQATKSTTRTHHAIIDANRNELDVYKWYGIDDIEAYRECWKKCQELKK